MPPHNKPALSDSDRFSSGDISGDVDDNNNHGPRSSTKRIQFAGNTHRDLNSNSIKKVSAAIPGFSDWRTTTTSDNNKVGNNSPVSTASPTTPRRTSRRAGRRYEQINNASSFNSSHSSSNSNNFSSDNKNINDFASDILAAPPPRRRPRHKMPASMRPRRRSSAQEIDSLPSVPTVHSSSAGTTSMYSGVTEDDPSFVSARTKKFSNTTAATMNKYKSLYEAMLKEVEKETISSGNGGGGSGSKDNGWVGLGEVHNEEETSASGIGGGGSGGSGSGVEMKRGKTESKALSSLTTDAADVDGRHDSEKRESNNVISLATDALVKVQQDHNSRIANKSSCHNSSTGEMKVEKRGSFHIAKQKSFHSINNTDTGKSSIVSPTPPAEKQRSSSFYSNESERKVVKQKSFHGINTNGSSSMMKSPTPSAARAKQTSFHSSSSSFKVINKQTSFHSSSTVSNTSEGDKRSSTPISTTLVVDDCSMIDGLQVEELILTGDRTNSSNKSNLDESKSVQATEGSIILKKNDPPTAKKSLMIDEHQLVKIIPTKKRRDSKPSDGRNYHASNNPALKENIIPTKKSSFHNRSDHLIIRNQDLQVRNHHQGPSSRSRNNNRSRNNHDDPGSPSRHKSPGRRHNPRDRSSSRGPTSSEASIDSQRSARSRQSSRSHQSSQRSDGGRARSSSRRNNDSRARDGSRSDSRSRSTSRHSRRPSTADGKAEDDDSNNRHTKPKKGLFRKFKKLAGKMKNSIGDFGNNAMGGVHKYKIGDRARYRVLKEPRCLELYDAETRTVEVEIVAVQVDAVLEMPYYTIRLPNGNRKQTNWDNLMPLSEFKRRKMALAADNNRSEEGGGGGGGGDNKRHRRQESTEKSRRSRFRSLSRGRRNQSLSRPGERSERSTSRGSIIGRGRRSLSRASSRTSSRGDDETDDDRSAASSQKSRPSSRSASSHRSVSSRRSARSESSHKSSSSKSHGSEPRSNGVGDRSRRPRSPSPFTQREHTQQRMQQPLGPRGSNINKNRQPAPSPSRSSRPGRHHSPRKYQQQPSNPDDSRNNGGSNKKEDHSSAMKSIASSGSSPSHHRSSHRGSEGELEGHRGGELAPEQTKSRSRCRKIGPEEELQF